MIALGEKKRETRTRGRTIVEEIKIFTPHVDVYFVHSKVRVPPPSFLKWQLSTEKIFFRERKRMPNKTVSTKMKIPIYGLENVDFCKVKTK